MVDGVYNDWLKVPAIGDRAAFKVHRRGGIEGAGTVYRVETFNERVIVWIDVDTDERGRTPLHVPVSVCREEGDSLVVFPPEWVAH